MSSNKGTSGHSLHQKMDIVFHSDEEWSLGDSSLNQVSLDWWSFVVTHMVFEEEFLLGTSPNKVMFFMEFVSTQFIIFFIPCSL